MIHFPWDDESAQWIQSMRQNKQHEALARRFERMGTWMRNIDPQPTYLNTDVVYIAPMLWHCAAIHYYCAGYPAIARTLAQLNVLQTNALLANVQAQVYPAFTAVMTELAADLHVLLDHAEANRLYESAAQLFAANPDDEQGETSAYYWDLCEQELDATLQCCFGYGEPSRYSGTYSTYTRRIPFKQQIQTFITLN
jgi:hypothetical protein